MLDEPTNDLDIPTLEILEESLLEFRGSLVLVTHDRYLLDRVSTTVLGLDGQGAAESFADYSQWETWQAGHKQTAQSRARSSSGDPVSKDAVSAPPQPGKKKLSYLEAREYDEIEDRVAQAEHLLQAKRVQLEDPAIASDAARLVSATAELEDAQQKVDALYARWAALERKRS